jgi:hypothetical protein
LFEEYYRDTSRISKNNMIAFLKAKHAYEMKPGFHNARAGVRIIVGGENEKDAAVRTAAA